MAHKIIPDCDPGHDGPELPDPGLGVRKAAKHVNTVISDTLTSGAFATLADTASEFCEDEIYMVAGEHRAAGQKLGGGAQ